MNRGANLVPQNPGHGETGATWASPPRRTRGAPPDRLSVPRQADPPPPGEAPAISPATRPRTREGSMPAMRVRLRRAEGGPVPGPPAPRAARPEGGGHPGRGGG